MSRFKHILFPVDFSERCRAIQPFVEGLAQRFEAQVTLMHVVHIPAGWNGAIDAPSPMLPDVPEMESNARRDLVENFQAGRVNAAQIVVDHGDPATKIVEYAHTNGVDLIMIPTHGYGKVRALLLGSVTAKVLHDARCAVWTACHLEESKRSSYMACENMLCAIDTTPEDIEASIDIIRYAADLASRFRATLRLVHAVPGARPLSSTGEEDSFNRFLLATARDEITRMQQCAGTNSEVYIDGGKISKVVRDTALHHGGDLIIIGRGKQHDFLGRLRAHAYSIIRDAPCPVLSV